MLAPMCEPDAGVWRVRGVHATYLSDDGRSKAAKRAPDGATLAARKMWGRSRRMVCPLSPLTRGDKPLYVGEGVETVLSAVEMLARAGETVRAAAVLTLGNLQGGALKTSAGALHWPPVADPDAPPWTMPDPGEVVLLIDRDMAPIKVIRRSAVTRRATRELDSDARADLCAQLARQAWRAAGASSVRALMPRARGDDFNDQLRNGDALCHML